MTDSVFLLAERIARAELVKGQAEGRVRNATAFERKVRDNLLERTQQRGSTWLVEQASRFGIDIPADLEPAEPTKLDKVRRKPALCRTCGITVEHNPNRPIEIIDDWPVAVADCARSYDVPDCRYFQERGHNPLVIVPEVYARAA